MAASPSDTGRLSAWAAVASATIALVATGASLVSTIAAIGVAHDIADVQRQDGARAEISSHLVKMSELDRTGGSTYRSEIVTLAKQVEILVVKHGQKNLNLSASTYRLVGLFVALSTTDLELAGRMAHRALDLATRMEPDGSGGLRMADPLEALQAHRVLADVAAQNLDLGEMTKEYEAALNISEAEGARNRYVEVEARQYTKTYWALSAMMLVDDQQNPTPKDCVEVRRRTIAAQEDFKALALGKNLEIARRARRIKENVCAAPIDLLSLKRG
ncbi:hypothetical protein [Streptomyces sp. ADI95-16]|uniref:hypothetical protein n=1 Tax=Streptomyces sp. ADI95-16 TaxID=1522758 RepID=UPI0013DE781D|nr:hypothetical protein [Streptomyces sp. ADI95-16]